jgi:hypothetical protein
VVLEKVCEYMAFKTYYDNAGGNTEVPVHELLERIQPEVALELCVNLFPTKEFVCWLDAILTSCRRLLAADYLEGIILRPFNVLDVQPILVTV